MRMPQAIISMTRLRRRSAAVLLSAAALLGACSGVKLRSPIAPAAGPPPTFVQTTSDARATRLIDVQAALGKTALFHAASEVLSQKYSIDVSDSKAGFLMTPWQASSIREGAPELRYRTRITIRFLGDDWNQAVVRADANWQRGDDWDIGLDTKLLNDVSNELVLRIGKK